MSNRKKALGRGLANLIPTTPNSNDNVKSIPVSNNENDVMHIDINDISTNPFQPRLDFDEDEIKGLAESIKNQGLLQPVVLRKLESGKYQIISGERRYRALKHLGKVKIPSLIKTDISDTKMLEMALVENIQRENLNEIEKAISYQKLLKDCGLSHQELSEQVGKSRSVITNSLRLLKLPDDIQMMVRRNELSTGHARAIAGLSSTEDQMTIAERVIFEGLSVRDVESLVKKIIEKGTSKEPIKEKVKIELDPDLLVQEEKLRYRYGTDVKISMNKKNKGKIEIAYYNNDDLDRVLSLLFNKS